MSSTIHLAVATLASLAWSVLAMSLMRAAGVDLKSVIGAFTPRALAIAAVSYVLILATTLALAFGLDSLTPSALGFGLPGSGVGLAIGEVALTLAMLWGLVALLRRWLGTAPAEEPSVRAARARRRWLAVPLLVVGALWEEALYRGYFLALLRPIGLPLSVGISAGVFTAIHFVTSKGTALRALNWLLGGLALAFIYLDSESIWVATAAHFSRNLGNALVLIPGSGMTVVSFRRPVPEPVRTAWYVVLSIATVALAHFAGRW